MIIGKKLFIPNNTKAVLWDMDGVLIDSLGFDVIVVSKIFRKYFGSSVKVSRQYIKTLFAYDPLTFWQLILKKIAKNPKVIVNSSSLKFIHKEYNDLRQATTFRLCPGILKIIMGLKRSGIKQAVVSNNPTKEVKQILKRAGIANKFDWIFGNDIKFQGKLLAKKPSPDTYLFAIKKMGMIPKECVIIEDSEIGVRAGKSAGCFTVAVATGGATKSQLQKMQPKADKIYSSFI